MRDREKSGRRKRWIEQREKREKEVGETKREVGELVSWCFETSQSGRVEEVGEIQTEVEETKSETGTRMKNEKERSGNRVRVSNCF